MVVSLFCRSSLLVLALLAALHNNGDTTTAEAFCPLPRTAAAAAATTTTTALGLFEMFNEGKKLLVKKLAGDFDQVAIRSRLDSLVAENPVLMLR